MITMTYQLDATNAIRDQDLVGDSLVLSDDNCRALIRSTLTGGVLTFAQPRKAGGLVMSTLKDCVVDAGTPQRDSDFFTARFIKCRFHGVFIGIDFGQSHNVERDGDFGGVEGCDFTNTTLDGCRFFNVDASTLRLPAWPHVVLHDFAKRSQDVAAADWPGKLGQYMRICADQPESVKVSVIHVPSLARLVECSEEEIRAAFEKFGGLLI